MSNFTGNLTVSGTVYANGTPEIFSGTLGITLTANVNGSGNGTGSETVSGSLSYHFTYQGHYYSYSAPLNFTDPNLSFISGSFTDHRSAPVGGATFGITLSGTLSGDQHSLADSLTITLNGTYSGVFLSGTIYASGTLVAPYVPTITGTAANQTTLDNTGILLFQNVTIGDANGGTITASVTPSSTANGTFSNLGGGFTFGNGVYSVTGTAAQVTAALDGLVFNPTLHQAAGGQTVTTGFTIHVTDNAGGDASNTTTSVIATETGLSVSGTAASLSINDVTTAKPFQNTVLADTIAGATVTATVTLSAAANGALSNLGGGSYNAGTGIYTVSGTAAQVTAALDGLVFAPTLQQGVQGTQFYTLFTLQASDSAGGTASSNNTSVTTTESGVSISGTVAGQTTLDVTPITPFHSVVIFDPNPSRIETVTLTNYAWLTGTLSNLTGGSYNAGTGVYSVTGTAAQVTAAVDGLVLTGTPYNRIIGEVITEPFRIHVTNDAGSADDVTTTVLSTTTGPTVTGTIATAATLDADSIALFENVVVTETDPTATETAHVFRNGGLGTFSNLGGGSDNVGAGHYTVTGTAAQVTAALQGLVFNPQLHQSPGGTTQSTSFTVIIDNSNGRESVTQQTNLSITETGPTLTLAGGFLGANGKALVMDAAGDLFGTTTSGGTNNFGVIYEIVRTAGGFASPATLFNATYSGEFNGGLMVDAAGNLLGTATYSGGANPGQVFEIAKTGGSYATSLTTLASFNTAHHVSPQAGLVADAAGNLFGASAPGTGGTPGTVFEIAKTAGGYAATATTLYSFGGATDGNPNGSLFVDANGNLFGTTVNGGANGLGTVFEIAWTGSGYASAPTVLADFDASTGINPAGNLIMDAAGNLYGTTSAGSSAPGYGDPIYAIGTLYELVKAAGGYDNAPDVLTDFGLQPSGNPLSWGGPYSLTINSAGNIFGVAGGGPSYGGGKIFELPKSPGGYPADPTVLYDFTNSYNSSYLFPAGLVSDTAGNLYTSVSGTSVGSGAVVELLHSGFHASAAAVPANDFNLDGNSDILWQNADGTPAIWFLNGGSTLGGGVLPNPGPGWNLKATGDFDDDGKADLAWQNNDGTVAVWLMNGTTVSSGAVVGSNPGTSWKLVGTGDFDGDGKSDLLYQNTNGTAAIWLMNGTTTTGGGIAGSNPGTSWHIKATGDFNGDGKSDILWQNDDGTVAVWLMNGTTVIGGGIVGNPGASWQVKGAGDFNGDGKSDILWQNTDGTAAIWLMDGAATTGGGIVGSNPGTSWQVMGSGDYNGDGKSDILWQNTDGTPAVWLMNGTTVTGGGIVGSNPGTAWHVVAATG